MPQEACPGEGAVMVVPELVVVSVDVLLSILAVVQQVSRLRKMAESTNQWVLLGRVARILVAVDVHQMVR